MAEYNSGHEWIGAGGELSLAEELWVQEVANLVPSASQVLSRNAADTAYEWVEQSGGGASDHGSLTGLSDDDHSQYLLVDGTRALGGSWNMGNKVLTNVNIDSGVITGITDLLVADGGTGRSSHTAYAVICGGTTSTAVQQSIAALGASGTVLTSNGAGVLPTFQVTAGGGDVLKVGTPVDNQVGVWTGDGTIEGTAGLTYDGSNLLLTGDIGITGTRITKGWFVDLQVTNAIAGSITGNAATVTTITGLAPDTATTQASQPNITSVGTLTSLTVDDVAINGKIITMTGSAGDTAVLTVLTNGAFSLVTTDTAAAAANIQITADGTVDIDSAGVLTLDSGAAINIEPASGSAILLDGTISVDAGVVTGATSITSTTFVGALTGTADNVTTNANLTGIVTSTGNATAIADKAIAIAKLADGTDGELVTWGSTGVIETVSVGTSGQVLTSNGVGAAPTFQAQAGGGDVSKVGTPVDNQVGVWTGDGTIEGTSGLTYDGSNLLLTGDIGITGTRITKGWFTDLQVTNNIAGSITGNAATVTTITGLAPDTATTQATQPNIATCTALTTVGTLVAGNVDAAVSAADLTTAGKIEVATIAETDTGTDAGRSVSPDGLQGSFRNLRFILFDLVADATAVATDTSVGGDFPVPFSGVIVQADANPDYCAAYTSTAGTTGTMVVDVHLNGTTIMTTNKLDIETTEKDSTTATTQPDLTTTAITAGDILTFDIDAIHTAAAKGLKVMLAIRPT